MLPRLLIVDDDEEIRTQMKWALGKEYQIFLAEDRVRAIDAFMEHRPPVVLLDLGLPPHRGTPEEGLAVLSELIARDRFAKIIIVSGQAEKTNALQAIGAGAYDFLTKPVDVEELKIILRRTFHVAGLERDYRKLQAQLQTETFEGLLGTSPQIQRVFASVRKVAATNAPVLILGESGTGKEMLAQAIHRLSSRKDGP
ncbi:MAG: response regulator, partial [Verrucomicrobiota bacterium]|nr:response regulator [Verrucomicrobiota bacterium]